MERQGAEVVSYDLSPEQLATGLDTAPSQYDQEEWVRESGPFQESLNNSYWLCHKAFQSKAKVVYGTVYSIPEEIGPVDISVLGCILLHLRDPFLAISNALKLTRETVVIVEPVQRMRKHQNFLRNRLLPWMFGRFVGPYMVFSVKHWKDEPQMNWWIIPPETIQRFIATLGFEKSEITYHFQEFEGKPHPLYTVVGQRTKPL